MTKYNVHLYAIVRVKVSDIEAPDPKEACRLAESTEDLYRRFNGPEDQEYGEEIDSYLVDVVGDEEYEQSHFFQASDLIKY